MTALVSAHGRIFDRLDDLFPRLKAALLSVSGRRIEIGPALRLRDGLSTWVLSLENDSNLCTIDHKCESFSSSNDKLRNQVEAATRELSGGRLEISTRLDRDNRMVELTLPGTRL